MPSRTGLYCLAGSANMQALYNSLGLRKNTKKSDKKKAGCDDYTGTICGHTNLSLLEKPDARQAFMAAYLS